MSPRRVVLVVFDGLQSLDAVGPLEVLRAANLAVRRQDRTAPPAYDLLLASVDGEDVRAHSGLRLGVDGSVADLVGDGIHTLLVAGGTGVHAAIDDGGLVAAVSEAATKAERVTSVCTGAFALAAAGLLAGKRCTTHWASSERLAGEAPEAIVEPDRIYVRDGDVWTSAGVTAGMDLALALVREDLGDAIAHDVASWLVLFTQRPGGQSQFSAALGPRPVEEDVRADLAAAHAFVVAHPAEDCTVDALAARAAMSPRNFARAFAAAYGTTPARFVEQVRLERARQLLEHTDDTVDAVARQVGLSSDAVLHRLFRRRLGTTPASYRAHFARVG